MKDSQYLEQNSVKIDYNGGKGSGTLVISNNFCYLITAKHNFRKNNRDTYRNILLKDIEKSNIEVKSRENKEFIVRDIVYDYDDLIIFLVDGDITEKDQIHILKGNPTNSMDYLVYGYPSKKRDGHFIKGLHSRYKKDKNIFTLHNRNRDNTKYIEGLSGSGVFTENEQEVYSLCGIILQSEDGYNTLNIFDLSSVIDEINQELIKKNYSPIKTNQSNFYFKEIHEMYDLILFYHKDNFLVQDVKKIFGKKHQYYELIHPSKKLKFLNQYIYNTNEFNRLENSYIQELADMYLLGAFIASKYQDKEEALKYLNKARKFRPEYAIFLAEIDKENSKEELFKLGKLAYTDMEYSSSYDYFQKILSLKLEKFEEIIVYEYLIKILKKINRQTKCIIYYKELLELYEDYFQKANIYYELSLIENRESSINYANKGCQLIEFTNAFELKYLLYKRLFELTENKQVYSLLESTLNLLVKYKSEYKYELSTLRYSQTLDTIGWLSYFSMLIILLLSLSILVLINPLWSLTYITSSLMIFLFSIMAFFRLKMSRYLFWFNTLLSVCSLLGSFLFYRFLNL